MLWDTGAQVSVISGHDMSQYFPDIPIRKIEDFLGTETEINLVAANGTEIPYKGWAELDFRVPDNQSDINVIKVPFLVTAESIDMPIIGINVIEQIVCNDSADNPDSESCFSKVFVNTKSKNAEALVSLIRTIATEDKLGSVKSSKRDFVIPKNKTVEVPCRANLSLNEKWTPVIFEPHVNPDVPDGLSVTEAVLHLKGGSCQLLTFRLSFHLTTIFCYLEEISWVACNWFIRSQQLMLKSETLTV